MICRFALWVLLLALLLPVPVSAAEEDVVIVLDPGHGGLDSGTVSEYDGCEVWESELNLKIAFYCRDYLLEHYENVQVLLTREEDVKVSLDERLEFARAAAADYLLSIHINSDEGDAQGALALVPQGKYHPEQAAASTATAVAILEELEALGLVNLGTVVQLGTDRYPDGSRTDAFAIIRGGVRSNIPSIIMEHGFLDNESDYRNFLSTEEQLAALGRADALGLAKTLGLEEKRSTSAALGDTPFEDVLEDEWYYDAVTYVWEQELMQGISQTQFGAEYQANRAMVVTLLYRMEGAELVPEGCTFEDVEPESWYHPAVEWAFENGITTGDTQTTFAPGRNVIREQFVTFLHRYAGEPEPQTMPEHYADWESVSGYAQRAVAWAVEAGLMTGYSDNTVRPLRELNRAELAVLMQRFHIWKLHENGELEYEWKLSDTERALQVGESFALVLTNQIGAKAQPVWTADCEGVVQIDGNTVTALAEGSVLLSCEWEGMPFDCFVEVLPEPVIWTISHEDVTIRVGERFRLRLRGSNGETAEVVWTASKDGIVTIDGNQITGKAKGTITVSCEHEGEPYQCTIRVK